MKIHIKNFGPISSFSFDLEKDLHVLYGKNNIGKSYAISVVYLILKTISNQEEKLNGLLFLLQENSNQLDEINRISSRIEIWSNSESISIKNDFEKLLKRLLRETFLSPITESFKNTFPDFSNLANRFSKEETKIVIYFRGISFTMKIDASNNLVIDSIKLLAKCSVKSTKAQKKTLIKEREIRFYVDKNNSNTSKKEFEKELIYNATALLSTQFEQASNLYNDVFFLPASRSGLYEAMNIFSSIFARLSQLRHLIKDKIDIPSLSEPMSDYFLNLSNIKIGEGTDIYHNFAKEIEEKILKARIEFNEESKKLEYFNENVKLRLDLGETSSMVSEIAPIVAYLKYIINEKPTIDNGGLLNFNVFKVSRWNNEAAKKAKIIFIEEPEAHLHPEIQILLTDIFVRLTKHNVKIVLTTHSNYIFNKVNNLILSKELATEKIANYHLVHTEKGSIVREENELTEEGMEDDNFVPIAEQLYKERLDIYENQN